MRGHTTASLISRSHAILSAGLLVSAALHGAVIVGAFVRTPSGSLAGAMSTAALSWAALRWSLRTRRPVLTWLFVAIAAGVCNASVLVVLLLFGREFGGSELPVAIALSAVVGAIIAVPFAAMGALLVACMTDVGARPSLDRPWAAALAAGAWSMLSACVLHGYAHGVAGRGEIAAYVLGAVSAVVAIVGAIGLLARTVWLARVRRSLVSGWAVVPASALLPTEATWWSTRRDRGEVLVREARAGTGPYREGSTREIIARV